MRGRRIDISRSEMLAKVVCWWLLNGAPPVDEDDARQYDRIDCKLAHQVGRHVAEWHGWTSYIDPGSGLEVIEYAVAEPKAEYPAKNPLTVKVTQRKTPPRHSETA